MADRNPAKQRRQAQNRAARDARAARTMAAGTPVEERSTAKADADRTHNEKRSTRRSNAEVKAKARAIIDAEETGERVHDRVDDAGPSAEAVHTEKRRGSAPVFSAKHRAHIAQQTADQAPARTHEGVSLATGVASAAPRRGQRSPASNVRGHEPAKSKGSVGSQQKRASEADTPASKSAVRATTPRVADRSERAAKAETSPTPRTTNAPTGVLARFGGEEPGGRWVMVSFGLLLVASVIVNFVHILPEVATNAKGKQVRTGRMFTIWHYGLGPGLYLLLPPILILGLFILTARPSNRRRSWTIALMCLVFITYVSGSISIYLLPIAALAWGCWQARKAALAEVGGDPRVLKEVERERRISEREALRAQRAAARSR